MHGAVPHLDFDPRAPPRSPCHRPPQARKWFWLRQKLCTGLFPWSLGLFRRSHGAESNKGRSHPRRVDSFKLDRLTRRASFCRRKIIDVSDDAGCYVNAAALGGPSRSVLQRLTKVGRGAWTRGRSSLWVAFESSFSDGMQIYQYVYTRSLYMWEQESRVSSSQRRSGFNGAEGRQHRTQKRLVLRSITVSPFF